MNQIGGFYHDEPITLNEHLYERPKSNINYLVSWNGVKLVKNKSAPQNSIDPDIINLVPLPFINTYLYQQNINNFIIYDKDNYVFITSKNFNYDNALFLKLNHDLRIIQENKPPRLHMDTTINSGRFIFTETVDQSNSIYETIYFNAKDLVKNLYLHSGHHKEYRLFIDKLFNTQTFAVKQTSNVINKLMFCGLLKQVMALKIDKLGIKVNNINIKNIKQQKNKLIVSEEALLSELWTKISKAKWIDEFHNKDELGQIAMFIEHIDASEKDEIYMVVFMVKLYNYLLDYFKPHFSIMAHTQNIGNIYSKIQTLRNGTINESLIKDTNHQLDKSLETCYHEFIADIVALFCHRNEINVFNNTFDIDFDLFTHIINIYCLKRLDADDVTYPLNKLKFINTYFGEISDKEAPNRLTLSTVLDRIKHSQENNKNANSFIYMVLAYIMYSFKGENSGSYCPIDDWSFSHKGNRIPDCGEKTTLNIINRLIWSETKGDIDIKMLPDTSLLKLKNFYSTYHSLNEQRRAIRSTFADKWNEIVSNISGVQYNHINVEIIPTQKNIIKVLEHILGVNPLSYPAFAKKITTNSPDHLFIGTTKFRFSKRHAWTQRAQKGEHGYSEEQHILKEIGKLGYLNKKLLTIILNGYNNPFMEYLMTGNIEAASWEYLEQMNTNDLEYIFDMIEDFGGPMINSILSLRLSGDTHWVWRFLTDPKYSWGKDFLYRSVLNYPETKVTIRSKMQSYVRNSTGHGFTTAFEKNIYPSFTKKLWKFIND